MKKNQKMSVKATRKTPQVTTYLPVSPNIYFDGYSFRVRVRNDGKLTSVSLQDKKKAIKLRDKLLAERE